MLCRGLLVELWLGRLLRGEIVTNDILYEFHEEIKPYLLS
jgi:hypothetical protein